jgi:DNA-directed RNA polymerase specialized sigma24 family protein
MIVDMIDEVLNELPEEQREIFIAHEFEEISFKDLSKKSGVAVNTLISRKRYAVLALRSKLEEVYKLFKNK